jgi:kinesin family protein 2/24
MHPDMKRMFHKGCWFPAHEAFDEQASNVRVFTRCAAPLVKAVARGGIGTLFMYGQTGSGKTHTMTGIEEGACVQLSRLLHPKAGPSGGHPLTSPADGSAGASSAVGGRVEVRLRYFELAGKRCIDLLGPKPGIELKLMNDGNDAVRPQGAAEPIVSDAAHLAQLIKLGKKRRATAPTDVNGGSSRSHAVCQIVVDFSPGSSGGGGGGGGSSPTPEGLLTLVDCAGSERKEDSMYHDKERQRESTEINASL